MAQEGREKALKNYFCAPNINKALDSKLQDRGYYT
jgi:hypothetical protein